MDCLPLYECWRPEAAWRKRLREMRNYLPIILAVFTSGCSTWDLTRSEPYATYQWVENFYISVRIGGQKKLDSIPIIYRNARETAPYDLHIRISADELDVCEIRQVAISINNDEFIGVEKNSGLLPLEQPYSGEKYHVYHYISLSEIQLNESDNVRVKFLVWSEVLNRELDVVTDFKMKRSIGKKRGLAIP